MSIMIRLSPHDIILVKIGLIIFTFSKNNAIIEKISQILTRGIIKWGADPS